MKERIHTTRIKFQSFNLYHSVNWASHFQINNPKCICMKVAAINIVHEHTHCLYVYSILWKHSLMWRRQRPHTTPITTGERYSSVSFYFVFFSHSRLYNCFAFAIRFMLIGKNRIQCTSLIRCRSSCRVVGMQFDFYICSLFLSFLYRVV